MSTYDRQDVYDRVRMATDPKEHRMTDVTLSPQAVAVLKLIVQRDDANARGQDFVPAQHPGFSEDGLAELWRKDMLTNSNRLTHRAEQYLLARAQDVLDHGLEFVREPYRSEITRLAADHGQPTLTLTGQGIVVDFADGHQASYGPDDDYEGDAVSGSADDREPDDSDFGYTPGEDARPAPRGR